MPKPSQRWADMTALVDAIERGRGPTAAAQTPLTRDPIIAAYLLERSHVDVDAGRFTRAYQRWRELLELLDDDPLGRGHHGHALGRLLFTAARQLSGDARVLALRRCVDVLAEAGASFELAGDLEAARELALLAARACDEWRACHAPGSPRHLRLGHLARAFRNHLEDRTKTR